MAAIVTLAATAQRVIEPLADAPTESRGAARMAVNTAQLLHS
ncbi:hypothetical protein [Actinomadura sp. WAC 06369]|nr:hypothetical protein [Actinomadura sp. WAC 06369]